MSSLRSRFVVGLGRVWLGVGLVFALTAALLMGSPSQVGAVAGYGDVSGDSWYSDAVQWSVDNAITGIGGFCFGIDTPVSRGETAVWIYNMENHPDTGDRHSFTDVTDASQHDAISWMVNSGITTGTSPTTFAPDETLRRAQAATFLHRLEGEPAAPPHNFSDVVAGWQQDAVSWMAHTGITTGATPTTFAPEGTLTRAQLVTFLYRYQGEPEVTINTSTPHCDPADESGSEGLLDDPSRPSSVFGAGDTISGFPSGSDAFSGTFRNVVQVSDFGGMVTITMSNGGTAEYSDATYTCISATGCVIENGRVARGTVTVSEALGLNIQVRTPVLAPTSLEDFKTRFVPYGLAADYYFVDLSGDGRFEQTTVTYTVSGRYTYQNTGERTATLTQDYDDGDFGGSCESHLVFDTAWTGTLEYSCADGSTSSQNWRVSEQPILSPPTITPVADTNTEVWISVFDTFGPQETRAYDYRVRATNQEGPPFEACTTISNSSGQSVSDEARTSITGLLPGTEYEFRYRYRNSDQCGDPVDIEWSHMAKATTSGVAVPQSPMFAEGSATTRSIREGTPPGVRVGLPVSARGVPALTYSVEGPDVDSFVVESDTGQIRTKAGIVYDYETKDQYRLVVRATDPSSGLSDTIDVTIHIIDLAPSCGQVQDLRVNPGDGQLTVRWSRLQVMDGEAPILGYQTEIRQSSGGSWSGRRVVLGSELAGLTYVDLINGQTDEIRVRPVNAEGDCRWSDPVSGTPSSGAAPVDESDLSDRIRDRWVGTPSRHWQILSPGRCRHRTGDAVFDAYCSYQRTAPDSGQISLEFDDPSKGSCDVVFAYSSLTAGSFVDDCWDAGVNTGGLRTDFVVPPYSVRTTAELNELLSPDSSLDTSSLAPRTQEEFDRLARGRRDFIPGVVIGELDVGNRSFVSPGSASLLKYDNYGRRSVTRFAEYRYENIGPSEGLLTITPRVGGETLSFRLGFDGGTMGITVEDSEGDPVDWWAETFPEFAGAPQLADPLPILLPSPPTPPITLDRPDLAPQNGIDFLSRFPRDPYSGGWSDIDAMLGDNALYRPFGGFSTHEYVKTDRNRATITLTFGDFDPTHPERNPALSDEFYEQFTGATWDIDIEFLTDGSIGYTATLSLDGSPTGLMLSGVVDYDGNRMDPDEFPPETLPPDDPPQARGQDLPGVDLAPATTAGGIGPNDLQPFLLDGADLEQAAYRPGDWLEPKDGSAQRMMIAGVNQVSTTGFSPSTLAQPHHVDRRDLGAQAPRTTIMAYFRGALEDQPQTTELPGLYTGHGLQIQSNAPATITTLLVVCMQRDREIPIRGARYFSQPKPAEGPVQTCQRNCVLNHREFIQRCVWQCEDTDQLTSAVTDSSR